MIPEVTNIDEKYEKMIKMADSLSEKQERGEEINDEEFNKMGEMLEEVRVEPEHPTYDSLTDEEKKELEKQGKKPVKMQQVVDHKTGIKVLAPLNPKNTDTIGYELDRLLSLDSDNIKEEVEISHESVRDTLKMNFTNVNIKNKDIDELIKLVDRYRRGEDFAYFNALPPIFKNNIKMAMGVDGYDISMNREYCNMITKDLFEMIIQNNYLDKATNDINEYTEKSLKDIQQSYIKPEFSNERIKTRTSVEGFLAVADKIQDEHPEQAERLRNFHYQYTQAYTYTEMLSAYKSKLKFYRAKKIELEKFSRECDHFCARYVRVRQKIYDVNLLYPTLTRMIPDIDESYIKRFILTFIKYTHNMDINDIKGDYIFIYYFMRHILDIDHVDQNNKEDVAFCDEVLDNIRNFCNEIKKIEDDIASKKGKK